MLILLDFIPPEQHHPPNMYTTHTYSLIGVSVSRLRGSDVFVMARYAQKGQFGGLQGSGSPGSPIIAMLLY